MRAAPSAAKPGFGRGLAAASATRASVGASALTRCAAVRRTATASTIAHTSSGDQRVIPSSSVRAISIRLHVTRTASTTATSSAIVAATTTCARAFFATTVVSHTATGATWLLRLAPIPLGVEARPAAGATIEAGGATPTTRTAAQRDEFPERGIATQATTQIAHRVASVSRAALANFDRDARTGGHLVADLVDETTTSTTASTTTAATTTEHQHLNFFDAGRNFPGMVANLGEFDETFTDRRVAHDHDAAATVILSPKTTFGTVGVLPASSSSVVWFGLTLAARPTSVAGIGATGLTRGSGVLSTTSSCAITL